MDGFARRGKHVINLALIGAGPWGRNLLRSFAHMKHAQLKICCDSDPARCAEALNGFRDIEAAHDPAPVLSNPHIDAVIIASPAVTHYEFALEALTRGKDVFVEKPMTLSLAHAEKLVETAKKNGRILMVGHLLEYHPGVNKMKELLTTGALGDLYYLYSERVNLGRIRSDENALWSFAPHDVSIILYLLEREPVEVSASGAAYIQPGLEDVAFVWMRFEGNVLAQIHVSWLDPHKIRRTTLVGSKKMVVFDDMEPSEKIRIYDKGVTLNGRCVSYAESFSLRFGEVSVPMLDTREPLKLESEHFVDCLMTRKEPRSNGADGLRVVRVLDAAQRSMKSGGAPVLLG